jgi:flagellar hook-associated protein 3 FlgL
MTITSVSTLSLGNAMIPAITQADAQLQQLETESATGQYADLGLQLGLSSGYELSLRNSDDLLQSITTANSIVGGSLSTADDALATIVKGARATLSTLVSYVPGSSAGADLGITGDDAMQSLVNQANSSYDDQYVFGGINNGTAPLAAFTAGSPAEVALASAFQTQFGFPPTSPAASTITGAQLTSFLNGAFASAFSGANWTTNFSSAASVNTTAEISPGETIQTSVNLNEGGFQPLTQAYAMLSMFGDSSLSSGAKQLVVTAATGLLSQGLTQLTQIGAQVGQIQTQVKQADDEMSMQMTLLKTQIGGLDNVDANQVATQLNTLTTQLETAYQVTAQLQKLSLAQYLPT